MWHPRVAKWFDIVVPRDGLQTTLNALADLHAVELEASGAPSYATVDLSILRDGLDAYSALERRYRAHWPNADHTAMLPTGAPDQILSVSMAQCRQWVAAAAPHIGTLQCAARQEVNLTHLRELAEAAGADFPVHLLLGNSSALFDVAIYLLEHANPPAHIPHGITLQTYDTASGIYLLAIGKKADIQSFAVEMGERKARHIDMSDIRDAITSNKISGIANTTATDMKGVIDVYIEAQRHRQAQAIETLDNLSVRYQLALVRTHLDRLRWLVDQIGRTASTGYFARITGWTALPEDDLRSALHSVNAVMALSVGDPPKDRNPPLLFSNPRWVRPFEAFVRLLGMPAKSEADPSILVALFAPLLFGYMFGDVGQGFVLLVAGLVLRRAWPSTAVLVPGGLMAMVFGFGFGSVFGREDIIAALWLHPLVNPIMVLGVALGLGVVIIMTGLALAGAQAHWRGHARVWWMAQAGLVTAYGGVLLSFVNSWGYMLIGAGALWFLAGSTVVAVLAMTSARTQDMVIAFSQSLGELLENLFQLLINTLSFVRVGAFAIAHAGLSSALVVLADITTGPFGYWTVMIFGNAFIIALEGLVAGIQTTRLMLFEFFIRFLRADGRPLRVLPTPAEWSMQLEGKSS